MKIIKYGLLILFISLLQVTFAQTINSITPQSVTAQLDTSFVVYISIEDANNLFGLSFNYNYDKKYIKLKTVTNESFMGNDVVFFPNDDFENGILSIGISRKAGQTNVSGNGNIIKAIFEVINLPQQDSTIEFSISDITANDSLGSSLAFSSIGSETALKLTSQGINKVYPISPLRVSGVIEEEFNTQIYVENTSNLFGISFNFHFSNNLLEIVSVQSGGMLGDDVVFFPNIDNKNGVVSVGLSKKAGQENVSGSGVLVNITSKLRALPIQDTSITFTITDLVGNDKDGNSMIFYDSASVTLIDVGVSVDDQVTNVPQNFELHQNYPNPFNPSTKINYGIPEQSFVQIKVYDILGSEVATLVNETKNAGFYDVSFDASQLSNGIYFYKIQATSVNSATSNFVDIKKMILLK